MNNQNDEDYDKLPGDLDKPTKKKQLIFETPEALLMTLSPAFGQLWNAKLTDKLQQLADLQASRETYHDLNNSGE